jgi:hypothetical protein
MSIKSSLERDVDYIFISQKKKHLNKNYIFEIIIEIKSFSLTFD